LVVAPGVVCSSSLFFRSAFVKRDMLITKLCMYMNLLIFRHFA
jgi:hypothetical protein